MVNYLNKEFGRQFEILRFFGSTLLAEACILLGPETFISSTQTLRKWKTKNKYIWDLGVYLNLGELFVKKFKNKK